MILEASACRGLVVVSDKGEPLGRLDFLVFHGDEARVEGAQVVARGLVKKFFGLHWQDVTLADRTKLEVAGKLSTNLKALDDHYKRYGKVLGVAAKTESGKTLGHVSDVLFQAETGQIVRFAVRNFLHERLVPQQFLVRITPKQIIFQDVVDQPIFNKLAANPEPIK